MEKVVKVFQKEEANNQLKIKVMTTRNEILNSEMVVLNSALTTITAQKLQDNVWKVFSKPFGNVEEYNDNELMELIKDRFNNGYEIELN